jgi:uncharacterized Zn-finger protein
MKKRQIARWGARLAFFKILDRMTSSLPHIHDASMPPEIISIPTSKTACDGDAASAHPRVFLTVNAQGFVDCPYCGKHFVLDEKAHGNSDH